MLNSNSVENSSNIEQKTAKKKLNLLQVFRGLAALLVVLCHSCLIFDQNLNQPFLSNIFLFGASGVDLFFVISGFIIFHIHSKDIGKPTKLKDFFWKRFVRVYPLYWLILTLKILTSIGELSSDKNPQSFLEIGKAYLLFPQETEIIEKFIGVSWTLSYEIFFYIMFGLLIYFKPKFSVSIIVPWLSIVFFNFVGIIKIPQDIFLLDFLFNRIHIEFLFGVLCSYLVSKYKITYGSTLLYVGIFLFTLSAISYNYKIITLSSRVISFGIPALLIILGSVALEMRKAIAPPHVLILLGDASYSTYLIHSFVINNLTKAAIKLGIVDFLTQNSFIFSLFAIINTIVTLLAGVAFYLCLEKPLLSFMKRK
ncbi:acyltransferase family protein [Scytonema sp. UIC 10036]|uniref:acyltransferase family protein n=1 Tax=Scytonema sp. UIC 10036 TaxID=2304196 RepID=UPI0012DAE265|nr:acyltransferase [Scytonema sp. UIC 10036]MUG99983.1 acyltransferase family protein [Scytonema sp. UIC 10036]